MNASRIVTAREAERLLRDLSTTDGGDYHLMNAAPDLAHTVATEPGRTRAAVVKTLQDLAESNFYDGDSDRLCDGYDDLIDRAIAIENGADYA